MNKDLQTTTGDSYKESKAENVWFCFWVSDCRILFNVFYLRPLKKYFTCISLIFFACLICINLKSSWNWELYLHIVMQNTPWYTSYFFIFYRPECHPLSLFKSYVKENSATISNLHLFYCTESEALCLPSYTWISFWTEWVQPKAGCLETAVVILDQPSLSFSNELFSINKDHLLHIDLLYLSWYQLRSLKRERQGRNKRKRAGGVKNHLTGTRSGGHYWFLSGGMVFQVFYPWI